MLNLSEEEINTLIEQLRETDENYILEYIQNHYKIKDIADDDLETMKITHMLVGFFSGAQFALENADNIVRTED